MLTLHLAELSETSGPAGDGVVRGSMGDSQIIALLRNTKCSPINYIYLKKANSAITDLTAAASSDTSNFNPFDTGAAFVAGNQLFISSDTPIQEIYFNIVTSAVWSGAGFTLWDSFDGRTPNRQLTIITDETDGLRAAPGVHRITFEAPGIQGLAFTPNLSLMPKRSWLVLKLNGVTSITTAPVCARLWIGVDESLAKYDSITEELSSNMLDANFDSSNQYLLPVVGAQYVMSLPYISYGLNLSVFRRTLDSTVIAHEYFSSSGTWKHLSGLVDESNDLKNGPDTLGTEGTLYKVRWTLPPPDWEQNHLILPLSDGTTMNLSGFLLRAKIVSIGSVAPSLRPLFRARCLSFGEDYSSGIYHKDKTVYMAATFEIGVPSPTDVQILLVNINTAQMTTFTIPANATSSCNLPSGFIALNAPLVIDERESLMIAHSAGGLIQDLELSLQ
jgi:hypothetical protein